MDAVTESGVPADRHAANWGDVRRELREQVDRFMARVRQVGTDFQHEEGFSHSWRVRGDHEAGVFASYSGEPDLLSFGVVERMDGELTNLLDVTVAFEEQMPPLMKCLSETHTQWNFECQVEPGQGRLDDMLKAFDELLGMKED